MSPVERANARSQGNPRLVVWESEEGGAGDATCPLYLQGGEMHSCRSEKSLAWIFVIPCSLSFKKT